MANSPRFHSQAIRPMEDPPGIETVASLTPHVEAISGHVLPAPLRPCAARAPSLPNTTMMQRSRR